MILHSVSTTTAAMWDVPRSLLQLCFPYSDRSTLSSGCHNQTRLSPLPGYSRKKEAAASHPVQIPEMKRRHEWAADGVIWFFGALLQYICKQHRLKKIKSSQSERGSRKVSACTAMVSFIFIFDSFFLILPLVHFLIVKALIISLWLQSLVYLLFYLLVYWSIYLYLYIF